MLCQKQNRIIINNIKIILYCVIILSNTACSKNLSFNEWTNAKNNIEEFIFVVNEPFNSEKLYKTQIVYFKPLLGSRSIGVGDFNLTTPWTRYMCSDLASMFYRSKNIFYSPKLGTYLRLHGAKQRSRLREGEGCSKDKYKDYSLRIAFQRINETNKNLPVIPQTLKSSELKNGEFEKLYFISWYETFGHDCSFDYKNTNLRCYNELDTHDYERFFFMGNQGDTKHSLLLFIRTGDSVKKKNRLSFYEKKMNLKTISKYNFEENNPNKNNFENLFVSMIKDNAEQKHNDKVLIIVPKDQVKLFIKTIKKIPDNELSNIKGYVWFEPKWRGYTLANETPYKPKKYDVLPNDKYDAELTRISNGNLKAKYGRYLTKERYSENYIAPSIYNNNYNDMPDW